MLMLKTNIMPGWDSGWVRLRDEAVHVVEDPSSPFKDTYKSIQDGIKEVQKWWADISQKANIEDKVKSLIKEFIDGLKSVLNDFAFIANDLILKSGAMFKDLIDTVFIKLNDFVSNIIMGINGFIQQVNDLLNRAAELGETLISMIKGLITEIFSKLNDFRQALFDNLNTLINNAEAAADRILYKGQVIATGTIQEISLELQRAALGIQDFLDHISILDPNARKRKEISKTVRKYLSIDINPIQQWGNIQTYNYLCCYNLMVEDYEIEKKNGSERIGNIIRIYADLQDKAWRLSTLGRSDSALSKEATKDWVKYGQLYELWTKLGDEDMGLLDTINDKLRELDQAKDEFERRSAQIESLKGELQNTSTQLQNTSAQIDPLKGELQNLSSKIDSLTNGGIADGLHKHSELSNSAGSSIMSIGANNRMNFTGQPVFQSNDKMHIWSTKDVLIILNMGGAVISQAWGGNGNLLVEGDIINKGRIL